MAITIEDVRRELTGPAELNGRIDWWSKKHSVELSKFVLKFRHEALLQVTPVAMRRVIHESSHALGDIKKTENHPVIRDVNPEWALEYLYHDLFEERGIPPTWDAFRIGLLGKHRERWYAPIYRAGHNAGLTDMTIHRAMHWRAGNAWQALTRQTYLFAVMRHVYDIPMRYHMLAHVLLKVDGWLGRKLVYVVMPNVLELRKTDPRSIFDSRGFETMPGSVENQGYGKVWLPTKDYMDRLAAFLKAT